MELSHESLNRRLRVGLFAICGLLLVFAITIFVNDKPFWWRPCELVYIRIEDATGLKTKSPVRSLGLQIGYLKNVRLSETSVRLGICITAPVEVLPETKAYIRNEGFLGDKFVELKPVRYSGSAEDEKQKGGSNESADPKASVEPRHSHWDPYRNHFGKSYLKRFSFIFWSIFGNEAIADDSAPVFGTPVKSKDHDSDQPKAPRDIPVDSSGDISKMVNRVDALVTEVTGLTKTLQDSVNPEQIKETFKQLNKTLENAAKTLSPEGKINSSAQRVLIKLEETGEQLRQIVTKINSGEGSVGKLLNDPAYADMIKQTLESLNQLLNKVSKIRLNVNIGGETFFGGYSGSGRGYFNVGIFPKADRYYLIGISLDPRGKRTRMVRTTTIDGGTPSVEERIEEKEGDISFTAMVGKTLWDKLDLSLGMLHGDGALSVGVYFPVFDRPAFVTIRSDTYFRSGHGVDDRLTLTVSPWGIVRIHGGIEGFKKVTPTFDTKGSVPFFMGASVSFDDDDIKLLLALR